MPYKEIRRAATDEYDCDEQCSGYDRNENAAAAANAATSPLHAADRPREQPGAAVRLLMMHNFVVRDAASFCSTWVEH